MKGFAQTAKWRPVGVEGGPEQPRAPLPSRAPAGFCSRRAAKPGMMPAHVQGHACQAPPCKRTHFTHSRPGKQAPCWFPLYRCASRGSGKPSSPAGHPGGGCGPRYGLLRSPPRLSPGKSQASDISQTAPPSGELPGPRHQWCYVDEPGLAQVPATPVSRGASPLKNLSQSVQRSQLLAPGAGNRAGRAPGYRRINAPDARPQLTRPAGGGGGGGASGQAAPPPHAQPPGRWPSAHQLLEGCKHKQFLEPLAVPGQH